MIMNLTPSARFGERYNRSTLRCRHVRPVAFPSAAMAIGTASTGEKSAASHNPPAKHARLQDLRIVDPRRPRLPSWLASAPRCRGMRRTGREPNRMSRGTRRLTRIRHEPPAARTPDDPGALPTIAARGRRQQSPDERDRDGRDQRDQGGARESGRRARKRRTEERLQTAGETRNHPAFS